MLSFKTALRFLRSGRTQTMLIVLGITIAVSVQIFVGLLIIGLQRSLIDSTVGNQPQITLSPEGKAVTIKNWERIIGVARTVAGVDAVSVVASGNGFVRDSDKNLPVVIQGFDSVGADQIYGLSDTIYQGGPISSRRQVLVGRSLAEELEIGTGDKLPVSIPDGGVSIFEVSGLYDLGIESVNSTWVISNLNTAQQLFDYGNRVTAIIMTVNENQLFNADKIATRIKGVIANERDIKVSNWKDQNAELLSGLQGQSISSTVIQAVVLASVVVAISSVLSITVLQKSRELGILKAMGIKDRQASLIFVYQGLLIGLVGAALGIAAGLGLLYAFNTFTATPEGGSLIDLYIDWTFVIRSWLIAVLSSAVAGLIPARRSLKLNPIEVIREG